MNWMKKIKYQNKKSSSRWILQIHAEDAESMQWNINVNLFNLLMWIQSKGKNSCIYDTTLLIKLNLPNAASLT